MKQVTRLFAGFLLLFFSTTLLAQQYYNFNTIGANNNFPLGIATGKTTQGLYLAGTLNQPSPAPGGNITKLYLMCNTNGAATFSTLTVKMGQTSDTGITFGGWYTGSLTTVYDETSVNITGTSGQWIPITLETPFPYNPALGLVIEIGQCGYSGSAVGLGHTVLSGLRRATGPLNPASCPHPYGNQGGHTMHIGVDISAGPVNCSYAWGPQVSGTTSQLFSVKAVNSLVAWAVGAAGTVRKTTDGGSTWTNGNPNPGVITGDIYNVEAIDANTAWVTTSPGATFIYKTTNGGTNWTQVYTLAAAFLNAIKMVSPTAGYAFGDPVGGNWLIIGTTDGGSTWAPISAPPGTGDGRNNCVQVSLPNIWFGTGQGTMWRSTNAGINWTSAPTTGIAGQVLSLKFTSAALGLVGGATLSKTTDGGLTFAAITAPGTGNISGIDGSGNDFWFVRGTGIYRSTDAGATWTSVHTAVGTQNDLKMTTDPNGCFVGWSGATLGNIAKMSGTVVGIGNNNNEVPADYSLAQNYPNPFNPITSINFAVPKAGFTELKVFDALGREVAVLYNGEIAAGNHTVRFDAANYSSGIYFYTLKSGDYTATKKMALIK